MSMSRKQTPGSGNKLKHCDLLFKQQWKAHRHCHKVKSPSFISGLQINTFMKKNVLDNHKKYRVCDTIAFKIKKVSILKGGTINNPPSIRRAHVSSEGMLERHAAGSKLKSMRDVQESFRRIVGMNDRTFQSQIDAVKAEFVWMAELDHGLERVGLFHRMEMVGGGGYFKVLEVKESEIEGGGLGLFACQDFGRGEIVTIYMGDVVDKSAHSIYLITNGKLVIDCQPWQEGVKTGKTYLGAHMVNDPNWLDEDGGGGGSETNICAGSRFEFVATNYIKAGDEILMSYNLIYD